MANNQSQYMKEKQKHYFLNPSRCYVSRQLSRAWVSACVHLLSSLNTSGSLELVK